MTLIIKTLVAIMLSVVMLSVVMLSVIAPFMKRGPNVIKLFTAMTYKCSQ